jgi:hypothetical protein
MNVTLVGRWAGSGLVVAFGAAACGLGGPPPINPADIARVQDALKVRLAQCSGQPSAARCVAKAAPVSGEPPHCAEFIDKRVEMKAPDGSEVLLLEGSWAPMPPWHVVSKQVLEPLPPLEAGGRKSMALGSMVPRDDDAAPPQKGDFSSAFAPLRARTSSASDEDLSAIQGAIASYGSAVESRLDARNAVDDPSWSRLSRRCFEEMAHAADAVKADLDEATVSVRQALDEKAVAQWLSGAARRCQSELAPTVCTEAPPSATAEDKSQCQASCKELIAASTEEAYRATVEACANDRSAMMIENATGGKAKGAKGALPKPRCVFNLPQTAVTSLDARGGECATACIARAKELAADEVERRRARAEGASLAAAFKRCIRDFEKSSDADKAAAKGAGAYDRALERKVRECRVLSRCEWMEKYSDRKCEFTRRR